MEFNLPPHLIPMSMSELRALIRATRLSLKELAPEERPALAEIAQKLEDELLKMQVKIKEFEEMTETARRATVERLRKQHFN